MIDEMVLSMVVKGYSQKEKEAIIHGKCPKCLPAHVPYRILETFYSETQGMELHRVKCYDIANCEWEEYIPNKRSDNGLEGFFES